jgi:hypothetical protein
MSKSTYELSSPTCSICNESFRGWYKWLQKVL